MKPKNIFLIRHGESEGNIDKTVYHTKPDYAIMLSPKGVEQAKECAGKLLTLLTSNSLGVYYSPYFRAHQTMDIVLRESYLTPTFCNEEVRLREQEWSGKLRDAQLNKIQEIEDERDSYGHFYYRLEGGESCADVYDRVSDFLDTLHRDFQKKDYPENICIFNHGMTMRVFMMRWFHINVEEFETWANPKNCEIWRLVLLPNGKYMVGNIIRKYEERRHQYQYKNES